MVFYSSLPIWQHLLIFWILLGGAACCWSNSRHNFAGGRHPTSGNDQHPQSTLLEEHFGSNLWGTFLNFFRIFYLLWIFQLMTGLPMLSYAELCMFQLPFPWYQIGQVWPLPTGIPPSAKSKPMYTMRIHLQHLNRFNMAQREVVFAMTVPFCEYSCCVSREMEFNTTKVTSCLWALTCLSTLPSPTVAMVKRTKTKWEWQRRSSHPWADLHVFINILYLCSRYYRKHMRAKGSAITWRMRTILMIVASNRLEVMVFSCVRGFELSKKLPGVNLMVFAYFT